MPFEFSVAPSTRFGFFGGAGRSRFFGGAGRASNDPRNEDFNGSMMSSETVRFFEMSLALFYCISVLARRRPPLAPLVEDMRLVW